MNTENRDKFNVTLPIFIYDPKVDDDTVGFDELIGSLPKLVGFPFLNDIKKRDNLYN